MSFPSIIDHCSASNHQVACTTHIFLQLDVDFTTSRITATNIITVQRRKDASEVVLDIDNLDIRGVWVGRTNEEPWALATYNIKDFRSYGKAFHIQLPPFQEGKDGASFELLYIKVFYLTNPDSQAICWLEPSQTADSPAVRITYNATVLVPVGYTALMSASFLSPNGGGPVFGSDTKRLYRFDMKQSIPSYLVALVVGDLASAEIGPRSSVWAEPSMLKACQNEFQGVTEEYIKVAEELYGSYVWERYDVLVGPPSWAYGGMEDPRLTIVSPCLIVGDKSLTDTIAHEIAHSWLGNLVTNGTWGDFFLNEGFTMYAQRRITTVVHGDEYTHLEALTGWTLLKTEIEEKGKDHPFTRLRIPLDSGEDPEDSYNDIPYEKGYALVCYLRSLVASDKVFDDWIKKYVADFQFQSILAEQMFDHFLNHFPELAKADIAHRPGFEFKETWLYKPGLPPYKPDHAPALHLINEADGLVKKVHAGDVGEENAVKGWMTYQILYFMDKMQEEDFSSEDGKAVLKKIGQLYGFADSHNAEISYRWSLLVIKNKVSSGLPQVEKFLRSQGKQKFTLGVYRALQKGTDEYREFARRVFEDTKSNLHVSVRKYVSKVLDGQAVDA